MDQQAQLAPVDNPALPDHAVNVERQDPVDSQDPQDSVENQASCARHSGLSGVWKDG